MSDVHAVQIQPLRLENCDLLLADPLRRKGVCGNTYTGPHRRARRGPQNDLPLRRHTTAVIGHLDDAGFDPRAFDTNFDFPHEQSRDLVGIAVPERAGNVAPDARRGDDVDPGAPRHIGKETRVASEIQCRKLNQALYAPFPRLGQCRHRLAGEVVEISEELRIRLQDARGRGVNVLVREREPQVSHFEGSEHGVNCWHGRSYCCRRPDATSFLRLGVQKMHGHARASGAECAA